MGRPLRDHLVQTPPAPGEGTVPGVSKDLIHGAEGERVALPCLVAHSLVTRKLLILLFSKRDINRGPVTLPERPGPPAPRAPESPTGLSARTSIQEPPRRREAKGSELPPQCPPITSGPRRAGRVASPQPRPALATPILCGRMRVPDPLPPNLERENRDRK